MPRVIAAALSVLLIWGLVLPSSPVLWLPAGILVSAAYVVVVTVISCSVKEYPKRALAVFAALAWSLLLIISYSDFAPIRDNHVWPFAVEAVGRRFLGWIWLIAPLFAAMSVAHPRKSRMHFASWSFFCIGIVVIMFAVAVPPVMPPESSRIVDQVRDWAIPALIVLALGPFSLAYGLSARMVASTGEQSQEHGVR